MPHWETVFEDGRDRSLDVSGTFQAAPSDDDIAMFERLFALRLPVDFVEFLQSVNGLRIWNFRFLTFEELELRIVQPILDGVVALIFCRGYVGFHLELSLRFQDSDFQGVYAELGASPQFVARSFPELMENLAQHAFSAEAVLSSLERYEDAP